MTGDVLSLAEEVKRAKAALKRVKEKVNLIVERNVQQTSGGTFFVCLPKKWAGKVGLKKGGKVTLVWSKDDTLTVLA